METTKEYAICKACGETVYRTSESEGWLLADQQILDNDGVDTATLPQVLCGCND